MKSKIASLFIVVCIVFSLFCNVSKACADFSFAPEGFDLSDLEWDYTSESSSIYKIAYSGKYDVLGIVFESNTDIAYLYFDVPSSEWNNLKSAKSIGGYYNQNIKGDYLSEKVDLFDWESQQRRNAENRSNAHRIFLLVMFGIVVCGVGGFCIYTKIEENKIMKEEQRRKENHEM